MAPTLKLSVLDQTPIPEGVDAHQALENSIDLARLAERLGYTRYWVAEHHGSAGLAGSAPEILIAHIAAATSTIRVGSGGVMLTHYSPLKVAEVFGLLEVMHPGRIDLGLGRAPGAEPMTTFALQRNRRAPVGDDFADQLAELQAWFEQSFPDSHPFKALDAAPHPASQPEIWLLTSSGWSARAAAAFGFGLSFAHFIAAEGGPEALETYRREFTPRRPGDTPAGSVAIRVVCAEDAEEAERLSLSARLWRYRQRRLNIRGPIPTVEEALRYPEMTVEDPLAIGAMRRAVTGDPTHVRDEIEALARAYGVDEVVIVTITHDHQARRRSYELVAEAFGLEPRQVPSAADAT